VALTESERLKLYEFVKQSSLGTPGADIVMKALPTLDWGDLATGNDLALLRADVRTEAVALRSEMAELRGELRSEMAELRTELRSEMAELRTELRSEMAELRHELRSEMAELRTDFRVEMSALETRLQRSIVTWILAAQGITVAAIGVMATVLTIVLV